MYNLLHLRSILDLSLQLALCLQLHVSFTCNYYSNGGCILFIAGLLSLVLPQRSIIDNTSPLGLSSLLLILILVHQHSREHNPYRDALAQFCDEKENKEGSSFQTNLEKLYLTLCGYVIGYYLENSLSLSLLHTHRELSNEHTTLFFYQLLHSNLNFASFVFSRSNIDTLVSICIILL